MRPRLSPVPVALVCAGALIAPTAASAAPATSAPQAAAAKAAPKKKAKKKTKSTAARVTSLSRSLNKAKAQQRSAQKQLDALVKQQALIGTQIGGVTTQIGEATNKVTESLKLSSPEGVLGLLQDPSSGIPQLLDKVTNEATATIRQLLASQEYAVAVVTVGNIVASPTLLVSPDISDIGAPVTFSGKLPVIVPPGVSKEAVSVRVGAVSLENDGTSEKDPAFHANLNHFSVKPAGYTGSVGDALLTGGAAGVNLTQTRNGQTVQCIAGANGCGAPVFSAPNPDFGFLPYYPVGDKLVSFGDKPGVEFDLDKMLALGGGGRLASISGGDTGPIGVTTPAPKTGVAMLEAEVSITVADFSVNPAEPTA